MPLLESFVDGGGSVASPAGGLVHPPQVNSVWGVSEPLFTLSFSMVRVRMDRRWSAGPSGAAEQNQMPSTPRGPGGVGLGEANA